MESDQIDLTSWFSDRIGYIGRRAFENLCQWRSHRARRDRDHGNDFGCTLYFDYGNREIGGLTKPLYVIWSKLSLKHLLFFPNMPVNRQAVKSMHEARMRRAHHGWPSGSSSDFYQ